MMIIYQFVFNKVVDWRIIGDELSTICYFLLCVLLAINAKTTMVPTFRT